jgi:hypothetical protein
LTGWWFHLIILHLESSAITAITLPQDVVQSLGIAGTVCLEENQVKSEVYYKHHD